MPSDLSSPGNLVEKRLPGLHAPCPQKMSLGTFYIYPQLGCRQSIMRRSFVLKGHPLVSHYSQVHTARQSTHLPVCEGSPVSGALLKPALNMKESRWTISKESLSFPVRCAWNPPVTVSGKKICMGSYMLCIDKCNQSFLGSLSFLFHSVFQRVLRNSNYCIRNKSNSSSLTVKDFYYSLLWHISLSLFFFFFCCYPGRVACIPIGSLKRHEAEHIYLFNSMYSNLTNARDRMIALCTVILV